MMGPDHMQGMRSGQQDSNKQGQKPQGQQPPR
jgi:hypothetical protein